MIVVTGATGSVGRALVALLPRDEVLAVVRRPADLDCPHAPGDFERPESIAAHLSPGDRLFLNSSLWPGVADAHRAVIDLAREAGVAQVVTVSVRHARPGGRLGQDPHGRIDEHLRASGLPHAILRPGGFMQNLLTEVRDGRFHGSYGAARVNYVDIRDVAGAAAALLTRPIGPSATYPLTGPEAFTHDEIAAAITAATGRPVAYADLPVPAMTAHLTAQGMPEDVAAQLAVMMREMETEDWASATTAVEDLTGRPPRSLADFLADHAHAFDA
ncbi:NAD(P)H-binding protein [Nonomuraea sp. MCN248]|uniref:NAD(P)H-binding protein n=1 Tax=Nonomuraea corallina TaxID=2989783 RepID=A0ABT4S762_9ACTN|nr:NAD(P)H-binding protein [Nonomuraea corallina]MDA0632898.1 NAD(P)H-binding protein [Nonomuraea corallina]